MTMFYQQKEIFKIIQAFLKFKFNFIASNLSFKLNLFWRKLLKIPLKGISAKNWKENINIFANI